MVFLQKTADSDKPTKPVVSNKKLPLLSGIHKKPHPPYLSNGDLVNLQRSVGNNAVVALLRKSAQTANPSQNVLSGQSTDFKSKGVRQRSHASPSRSGDSYLHNISVTKSPADSRKSPSLIYLQRKSTIDNISPGTIVASPIEVLSNNCKKYYDGASLLEKYDFHGIGEKKPDDYKKGTYKKAKEVTATIDPVSKSQADGSNRNNEVIAPYGHFGAMERSIFNRQNIGNTFDGGHLVEHTLMEKQDADVHGNIAPQESKNFNQGLMRGWESIPEQLMASTKFTYKVTTAYSDDNFQRTGEQLLKSGVLNKQLEHQLPPNDFNQLKSLSITFPRWIPTAWNTQITPGSASAKLPYTTVSNMPSHFHNLKATKNDAMQHVYTPDPKKPHLKRSNSGTLAGTISSSTGGTTTGLSTLPGNSGYYLGQADKFEAFMYQPDPLDESEQPKATTTPSGGTPAVIPTLAIPVNILTSPFSVSQLVQEIMSVPGAKNDIKVKAHSPHYKRLRDEISMPLKGVGKKKKKHTMLGNADAGMKFITAIVKQLGGTKPKHFTKIQLMNAIATSSLNKSTKRNLLLLENDNKMQM